MKRRLQLTFLALTLSAQLAAQNAADVYYDSQDMAKARAALKASHGKQINTLIFAERLEFQSNDGDSLALWEGQGWIGSDLNKLWIKTEGEYEDTSVEEAEIQALYSRAISPFWELQTGLRYDVEPGPARSYAVLGLQGLAPYWFEVDAALFLSDQGNVSARLEAEYELRLTQRLLLQPRLEINGAFSSDPTIASGSGLSTVQAGLRLRYEIRREFAPYVGVSWSEAFGDTRMLRRLNGEATNTVSFVAGLRVWF